MAVITIAWMTFAPSTESKHVRTQDSLGQHKKNDGHERMIEILSQIANQTPQLNPYLGRAEIERMQEQLNDPLLVHTLSVPSLVSFKMTLGFHHLRVGENQQAITQMEEAQLLVQRKSEEVPETLKETLLMMLAVAHLRVAETENCLQCDNGDVCIFPIQADALHVHVSGSRSTMIYLLELLEQNPENLSARWLLNIAARTIGEYPQGVPLQLRIPEEKFTSTSNISRFINRAPELGLDTTSLSGGIIVDDFNGDHLLDVVSSDCHPEGQLRLFLNQGDGAFVEATEQANLSGVTGGLNILQADYDNDGNLDILVLRGAWLGEFGRQPNSLLRNEGNTSFQDVTFESGLGDFSAPTQTAAWADMDLDGDLDLYVGNESVPSQLFVNNGKGRFHDIAMEAGVLNHGFTKGVVWGDYDADGDPDLYVSNLNGPNRLYQNLGNRQFRDVAVELGVEKPLASFPVFFWDYNNDGHLDLSVFSYNADVGDVAADYLGLSTDSEPDSHYRGDGVGGFVNDEQHLKLDRLVTHPMGANFGDFDNDGYLDIYLGTGDIPFQMLTPNLALKNLQGRGFADVTAASGLGHLQKGHGVSFADLDQDGDQDIMIELGGAFAADRFQNALFENTHPLKNQNHWISLRLEGVESNRSAIGAKIKVVVTEEGGERSIYRWVNSGGSFGANPLMQQIGLGQAERIRELGIFWPSGNRQSWSDIAADQYLLIREDSEKPEKLPWRATSFAQP